MQIKIKDRQKLLLIATGAAVALFLGDLLVLSPLTSAWKARSTRLNQLKQQVTSGKRLLRDEADLKARWSDIQTRALTNNPSAAEQQLFHAVDRWAQTSGVSIGAITPQWKRDNDNYMTYECRIDAAGDLDHLARFLHSAEREPLAIKFESVELSARDKEGQQLSLALQLNALLLNPPPQTQ